MSICTRLNGKEMSGCRAGDRGDDHGYSFCPGCGWEVEERARRILSVRKGGLKKDPVTGLRYLPVEGAVKKGSKAWV